MADNRLYSNSDFTFGVKVLDANNNVLPGSGYTEAYYYIYEADSCTPILSKTLGDGITAASGTFSFTVEYDAADLTVASFEYNSKGILEPNNNYYRHAFYVGVNAGERQPRIFNEQVDSYPEC